MKFVYTNLFRSGFRKKYINDKNYKDLVESIRENGIIFPIIITKNYKVIDGQKRINAARECGLKIIPVEIIPNF